MNPTPNISKALNSDEVFDLRLTCKHAGLKFGNENEIVERYRLWGQLHPAVDGAAFPSGEDDSFFTLLAALSFSLERLRKMADQPPGTLAACARRTIPAKLGSAEVELAAIHYVCHCSAVFCSSLAALQQKPIEEILGGLRQLRKSYAASAAEEWNPAGPRRAVLALIDRALEIAEGVEAKVSQGPVLGEAKQRLNQALEEVHVAIKRAAALEAGDGEGWRA